jgi:twitching motility two-component system response regulator PilG
MQNTDSISRAIHAARAGQPALARFHCQQAAEMQSDDPLVWLWLAWLSDSPSSMYQCLQVAQRDARYSEIAEAGIAFARALCGTETSFDGSPDEATSSSDVAASPLRIGDTHDEETVASTVAALPDSPTAEANDEPAPLQPEVVEAASETESDPETGPEQQCVEVLTELSAEVNSEDAASVGDIPDVNSEALLHPGTDLFSVAQAMLAESENHNEPGGEGLAAGVSVTNDPWTVRSDDEVIETENTDVMAESATEEAHVDHPVRNASPAWVENLTTCDDQAEWSAQDDEFIRIATSASAVEQEAHAEFAANENHSGATAEEGLTSNAEGLQPDLVNAQEPGSDVGAEASSSVNGNKDIPTVLVVDDSPTVRKLVQMTLRRRGYNVVTAFDGVSAIKEIARHEPWLILLDINMSRLDGYQLCSLIRKHERTQHIPVVMLSGKDGVYDCIRGKTVGCTSYITKPFAPEALIAEVEKYIGENAAAPAS